MAYHIYIELGTRRLILKNGGQVVGTYPVAIGKPSTPTPSGSFKVLNKINNPGGVLGTRWMQFTYRNHGIHGTNKPWLIGQAVSNGCVRMHNQNAEEVYSRVSVGTPVTISNSFRTTGKIDPADNPNQSTLFYTVRPGDSLWQIARSFNVSITNIRELNNLWTTSLIYPGQKLKLPINQAK